MLNSLTQGLTTTAALPFAMANRPFPSGPTLADVPCIDPYAFTRDYFEVALVGPVNLMSGTAAEGGYEVDGISPEPRAAFGAGSPLVIAFDPATKLYRIGLPTISDSRCAIYQTAFSDANLVSENSDGRLYARLGTINNLVREDVLYLRKVGEGTQSPNIRYATTGYFATGSGESGQRYSNDRRFYFVMGSTTQNADVPTTGSLSYTSTRVEGDAYRDNKRVHVTGSATAQVDVVQKKLILTIELTSETGTALVAEPVRVTATLDNIDTTGTYRGSTTTLAQYAFSASTSFFGPTAQEIGASFVLSSIDGSLAVHGSFIGRRR